MRETKGLIIESNRGQEAPSLGRVVRKDSAGDTEAETEKIRRRQPGEHGTRTFQAKRTAYSKARNTWHFK